MARLDRIPGVVLVSVAATMWGLDGLIRKPRSSSTTAYTIVFGEHVVLVLLTLPLLIPALLALYRAGPAYVAAGIAVGAGASAIATILFTKALFHGDFITVVVLQKAQPLIAVLGAWLLLGELAFPVTASLVGIYVFNSSLRWTQWVGVGATVFVISLLPARRRELVTVPAAEPAIVAT